MLNFVFDIVVVGLLVYGFFKGYKKGIVLTAIPFLSFISGMVFMIPLGALMYAVFGNGLESFLGSVIASANGDSTIATLISEQIEHESLVKNMFQVLMFIVVYIATSLIVATVFAKTRLRINNILINRMDKGIGGVIGLLTETMTVFLVMTMLFVFMKFSFSDINATLTDAINRSFLTRFLYAVNPMIRIIQ